MRLNNKAAAKQYHNGLIQIVIGPNYQEAYEFFEKAVSIQKDNSIYSSKAGNVALSLGKYDDAIKYFELALSSDQNKYGEYHHKVATHQNNLGIAWYAKNQHDKAIEYYELALASDIKTLGENHSRITGYYDNLGNAWYAKGDREKTIEYFNLALAQGPKRYGKYKYAHESPLTLNSLGIVWREKLDFIKAIEYFEGAVLSAVNKYGIAHQDVAVYRNNLGSVLNL